MDSYASNTRNLVSVKRCVFIASHEVQARRRDFLGHNYQRWILHALFHTKKQMLVQNGSIRMHFDQRKYTYKLSLGRVHSQFTSGIIKEWFLNITGSKYKELSSERYSDMLQNQLKPPIQRKCHGLLSSGVCLQHDNAQPHTAHYTVRQIQNLKLEVLLYPPYSSDLASSNFDLFWPLKDDLHGRHFGSDEEVKEMHNWLAQQRQDFFSQRIYALLECWRQCVVDNAYCIHG